MLLTWSVHFLLLFLIRKDIDQIDSIRYEKVEFEQMLTLLKLMFNQMSLIQVVWMVLYTTDK